MKTKRNQIIYKPYEFSNGNMPHKMIQDWKYALFGGIAFNVPGIIDWVLTPITLDTAFIYQFCLKLGSTIILGAAGAISTLVAKDLYRKIKNWYKYKNHE